MADPRIPVLKGKPAPAAVLAAVAEHGAALLRGGWSHEAFVQLGNTLITPLPYRGGFHDERDIVGGDDTVTTVTRGTRGMPLHREASYAPGSPDLLMFRCERPASDGGATTLCDGLALLRALPADAREAWEGLAIRWESVLPEPVWQQMCGTADPVAAQQQLRQWEPYLRPWESIHVEVTPGEMRLGFGTSCTPPTLFAGEPAFCNSVLITRPGAGEYRDARLRLRTADGARLSAELIEGAALAAAAHTFAVPWQSGDVLVVDNTRYLHGRQAFTDPGRTVTVRMGFLREELTA